MLFDVPSAAQALEDLLDHERSMILEGKITDLARGARQKEHLLLRLAASVDDTALGRIRRKAERNQALLAAAARGLKAARNRIGKIATGNAPMRTYGADGTARDIGSRPAQPGVNHRA